jgi:hypothetical protein
MGAVVFVTGVSGLYDGFGMPGASEGDGRGTGATSDGIGTVSDGMGAVVFVTGVSGLYDGFGMPGATSEGDGIVSVVVGMYPGISEGSAGISGVPVPVHLGMSSVVALGFG